MAEIDPKTGLKVRKLTELKNTAAQDYQDAMMKRVKDLAVQNNKVKDISENVIVKGLSTLLDLKIKLDGVLGSNKEKVQSVIENLLLTF